MSDLAEPVTVWEAIFGSRYYCGVDDSEIWCGKSSVFGSSSNSGMGLEIVFRDAK
jgi:hypothetical protein